MISKKLFAKLGAICFSIVMVVSNTTIVKAYYYPVTYQFKTTRQAGSTSVTGSFYVYPDRVYMGLGADDWSDLEIDGYVSDKSEVIEGGNYYFLSGAHDATSIGQTKYTAFSPQFGRCEYSASTYDGEADFVIWYDNCKTPNWGN